MPFGGMNRRAVDVADPEVEFLGDPQRLVHIACEDGAIDFRMRRQRAAPTVSP